MQSYGVLDLKNLSVMLAKALEKEKQQWRPRVFRKSSSLEVSEEDRNEAVSWLLTLNTRFGLSAETLALAIAIFDHFLQLVKVRPKYVKCVSLSCYYLASKTLEEDEVIPCTTDLVRGSQSGCTVAEVCRMERLILDKLNWSISTVTSIDFIHMIHFIMLKKNPRLLDGLSSMTPSQHLSILKRKLFICLSHGSLMGFSPVALVLALLSLELEQFTPLWLPITVSLQEMAQVDSKELIHCREQIAHCLTSKHQLQTGYEFSTRIQPFQKSCKRKVDHMVENVDEIYDSIKRLYCEEITEEAVLCLRPSCGTEARNDSVEDRPFPPIQTVSAT